MKQDKIFITGGSGFIGTNLVDFLISRGYENILNFDKATPIKREHLSYWVEGNIMDVDLMTEVMKKTRPQVVIHLAARTDTLSNVLEDYDENITGTKNVLNAIKSTPSVKRTLIVSTQYVYKSEKQVYPLHEDHYQPHTVYGKSKVLTEKFTRDADLEGAWTIVRPTNIWGPWHMRYPRELWKIIDKGFYVHPINHKVERTYGYVKNVVHQMYEMIIAPAETIDKKVFYVGDLPIDSFTWLNEFSLQLRGKKVRRLPQFLFKTIALGGDILRAARIPFPLYSIRYKNMIENYPAPTYETIEKFGVAENNMEKNVAETVGWLNEEGKIYFDYWKNK